MVGRGLVQSVIPGLNRDRYPQAYRWRHKIPAFAGMTNETETLHPHIRPFGHRVTLTAAPMEERTGNVQLEPGRTRKMRALRRVWVGGQGGSDQAPRTSSMASRRLSANVIPSGTNLPNDEQFRNFRSLATFRTFDAKSLPR